MKANEQVGDKLTEGRTEEAAVRDDPTHPPAGDGVQLRLDFETGVRVID
jgi:hypothetical protein